MATTDIIHVVGDIRNSKHAVAFLGGDTDDYMQINAAAVGQLAAAYTSGTWIAWIMPEDKTQTGTIVTFGDASVVEFIELNVEAGKLVARCTDNTTVQWVLTTDAVHVEPHKWTHVCLRHNGAIPELFVNGVKVAQTMSTATTPASWIAACGGLDNGRIGAADKDGAANITQEFGGGIGCVKLYGGTTSVGALTDEQILQDFKGTPTITDNLYNCWDWEDDLTDSGAGNDTATKSGDVVLSHGYCEFESKFRIAGFVTADYPVIAITKEGQCHCIVVKSA